MYMCLIDEQTHNCNWTSNYGFLAGCGVYKEYPRAPFYRPAATWPLIQLLHFHWKNINIFQIPSFWALFQGFGVAAVVSTVVSGVLFACFSTVDCINKAWSFLLWCHSCSKKVPVELESSLSRGGAITFLALFSKITFIGNNTLWVDSAAGTVIVKELMKSEESFIWSEYTRL